jgi:hypothetical protein
MSFGQRNMDDNPPVAWLWLLISTTLTRDSAKSRKGLNCVG